MQWVWERGKLSVESGRERELEGVEAWAGRLPTPTCTNDAPKYFLRPIAWRQGTSDTRDWSRIP